MARNGIANSNEPVYVYDPKFDITIKFMKEDMKRTEVIAWLLKNGVHKNSIEGILYVRKRTYKVQLKSEAVWTTLPDLLPSEVGPLKTG